MRRRILVVVAGCVLASGMVLAAGKSQPSPGDFHLTFGVGSYSGPVALVGAGYHWKKSGQSLGLVLLHGELKGTSGVTEPFRIGCKTYTQPFSVDDHPQNGVMIVYQVRVGG